MAAAAGGDTMQSFQKHIEDMRSLTLCKICLKPFFEPYIISCGHTYCYGCLRSWFGNTTDRKKTKSCPDCRVTVKVQPAPNYILRDLTHMFIDRAELLPEDESVQEHAQDKQDAAAQLTQDREGAGLFQGVFKQAGDFQYMLQPIRDLEDNVWRCPACTAEIEDGVCSGCGLHVGDSDFDSDSEDSLDAVMDRPPHPAFYGVGSDSDDRDTEDESNISGPDEYDRNDDFLDNEDEDDMDDLSEADAMAEAEADWLAHHRLGPFGYRPSTFRAYNLPLSDQDSDDDSDDEDQDEDVRPAWMGRRLRAPGSVRTVSEDSATNYDESEEEEQRMDSTHHGVQGFESDNEQQSVVPETSSSPARAPVNRRRPVVISDDEDDGNAQEEGDSHSPRARTISPAGGEGSDDNGTVSDMSSDSESDSDSDDSGDSESEDHNEAQEAGDSEDSDDTILPPQSRHMRQQRLQSKRARRPHQHQARPLSADLSTPPSREYLYGRQDDAIAQRGSRGRAARVY